MSTIINSLTNLMKLRIVKSVVLVIIKTHIITNNTISIITSILMMTKIITTLMKIRNMKKLNNRLVLIINKSTSSQSEKYSRTKRIKVVLSVYKSLPRMIKLGGCFVCMNSIKTALMIGCCRKLLALFASRICSNIYDRYFNYIIIIF